jgi:sugar O-acyltransferase (sialic acid O-acetyltransferase NeuD family)
VFRFVSFLHFSVHSSFPFFIVKAISDMNQAISILGAGGHAAVVISTLLACGVRIDGVYDDDASLIGTFVLGVPVLDTIKSLPDDFSGPAIIAVGNNKVRCALAKRFPQCEWMTAVHPRAYVHESVVLGAGCVVFAGGVVQPRAKLGDHVIVNTGATVDHDCRIGDFAHVAPGCHLAGNVALGTGVFMGIGSVVIQGVRISEWTTVGAGGVVIRDLPAGITAVGVPAGGRE